MLAYFGYPHAHEDDAERAVRAGLELIEAVARLAVGGDVALATRVGIATGQVLVGELIGEGAAQEEAVLGETPNLAARLQALAEPGAVVIAASTRRLVGGLFALTDLGSQPLKGFAEPVPVFQVGGEGRAEGRFEALRGRHVTPLVGRANELAILMRALALGARGRRSGGAALGRARDRQVEAAAGPARAPRRPAPCRAQSFLLAAPHQQRAASRDRPAGAGGGVHGRGRPAAKLARLETLFGLTRKRRSR